MTGVQIFLMGFGAVLAVIGVVVFFLLAWFKETTGQDHHNAIKILQAEFRFSNPALVIFAGGLLLMVAPFFLDQAGNDGPEPSPNPVVSGDAPGETVVDTGLDSQDPGGAAPAGQTEVDPPTLTVPPTRTPTPERTPDAPDAAGRWRNAEGYLEVRSLGEGELSYTDFDRAGTQVGQGSGWQVDEFVYLDGQGLVFDPLGNPVVVEYSADFELNGDVMSGDLFDVFGNYLGSVTYSRD